MEKRNRIVAAYGISLIAVVAWASSLYTYAKYLAETIAPYKSIDIVSVACFGLFALGGGVFVSLLPGFIYHMLEAKEDEITGEKL